MAPIPPRRNCGAHEVHLEMLQASPDYARARVAIQDQIERFESRDQPEGPTTPRVIPVVVHVIFRDPDENISDAQVASQIDALNRDYRKKNADVATVPAPFKPLATDAFIEFALARKDPDGLPTTGITRTQTSVPQFSDDNTMKFTAQGGHDAWDAARYLNIWVCPELIQRGTGLALLGYAQFPGGVPATDGVAIIHNGFGTIGTATPPFNLGRTATHEVGHWLDLFHIWGDENDCTGDDLVADTPRQKDHNFNKPTFPHVTCGNGPNGDMFMNYMDYVDDDAMMMFSAGQVARMQATLAGPRATIGLGVGV
jgi:hypothetical protein